uniref:Uncharacterized protein n=1 Tax=Oryza officinalis TaxID=4535 RepID=A0A1V1H6M1_9ORYZ|nr:hypothetical protein [Oryza officinalis]
MAKSRAGGASIAAAAAANQAGRRASCAAVDRTASAWVIDGDTQCLSSSPSGPAGQAASLACLRGRRLRTQLRLLVTTDFLLAGL